MTYQVRDAMPPHRFSVAMCTFNGGMYLLDQLESIAGQSRLPLEIVICDDSSEDDTLLLIESFASRAPFPVKVSVNRARIGSTKNFEKAIQQCQGDVVVLCDQDDVWHREKISRLEQAFSASPEAGLVFSNADMVDADLKPLGYSLWEALGFKRRQQRRLADGQGFEVLMKHNVIAGATLAFRARFRNVLLPIPHEWVHDGWIALVMAAISNLVAIEDRLIAYRQHGANQLGALKRSLPRKLAEPQGNLDEIYDRYVNQLVQVRERLNKLMSPMPLSLLSMIEEKLIHLQARRSLSPRRILRLPQVFREIATLRYFRYSNGSQSVLRDLLL
jgi:glycosyltransferase involved in cell wall biosynthesis